MSMFGLEFDIRDGLNRERTTRERGRFVGPKPRAVREPQAPLSVQEFCASMARADRHYPAQSVQHAVHATLAPGALDTIRPDAVSQYHHASATIAQLRDQQGRLNHRLHRFDGIATVPTVRVPRFYLYEGPTLLDEFGSREEAEACARSINRPTFGLRIVQD